MKVEKKKRNVFASMDFEEIRANHEAAINGIAENYLRENPITHPLGEYFKKVFIAAYKQGESIIDAVL